MYPWSESDRRAISAATRACRASSWVPWGAARRIAAPRATSARSLSLAADSNLTDLAQLESHRGSVVPVCAT